ncbi:MAG: chemotaxis protein CheD [Clostridiales bacterium]|nr:chemotaxis protein CheD [Clostridiales bacterium]
MTVAVILVGMADLNIAQAPDTLTTLGLGSCVGIALFDTIRRIGGMAHIMLPSSGGQVGAGVNRAKFADTAIVDLLQKMGNAGAQRTALVAKLAGGAHMFGNSGGANVLRVGERNVAATLQVLEFLKIPILANDTGGNYGRTIELFTEDGRLKVRSLGKGEAFI